MSYFVEELQELLPSIDPFFPFDDASPANSVDIFAEFQTHNVAVESGACSALFLEGTGIDFRYSSSKPCQKLENLTLYGSNWLHQMEARPSHDCWESVKREESEFGRGYIDEAFVPRSYDGCDDFDEYMMQDSFFGGHIRRACSTGDLQFLRSTRTRGSSPRALSSLLDVGEQNAKAIRCSVEERKEKILKYRTKRSQRNFNKTIKYVCRKALADTRPRIRGRFARNDEIGDIPKAAILPNEEEEEDLFWVGDETCHRP